MSRRAGSLRRDLVAVLGASAIVLFARASLADHYRVPSGSMEPTVAVGDQICVNKLAYGLRIPASQIYVARGAGPEPGDVVVLASPSDGQVLLKRVVAMPGDRVAVTAGRLVIDDKRATVQETDAGTVEQLGSRTHRLGTAFGGGPDFGPAIVPDGSYLVLGDNRGNSRDGRFFGWVARDAILGRAMAVCVHDGRPTWQPL